MRTMACMGLKSDFLHLYFFATLAHLVAEIANIRRRACRVGRVDTPPTFCGGP